MLCWSAVASALPNVDGMTGSPGNATATPLSTTDTSMTVTVSAAKARVMASTTPAKAAINDSAASPSVRPTSKGGARSSSVAATLPSAPPVVGVAEAAAFSRLRTAAAAVRGVQAPNVISRQSIRLPLLTIQVLKWLVDVLSSAGLSARAAPVLALWYTTASDLLPSGRTCLPVVACALAAIANWADGGGYSVAATSAWAGVVKLLESSNESDRGYFDGELAVAEMQRLENGPNNAASGTKHSVVSSRVSRLIRSTPNSNYAGHGHGDKRVYGLFRRSISSSSSGSGTADIPIRVVWVDLAAELARSGMLPLAKNLLIDVRRHATGFRDSDTLRKSLTVMCLIALSEGDFAFVLNELESLLLPATGSGTDSEPTALEVLDVILLLSAALREKGRHGDIVALLTSATRRFDEAVRPINVSIGQPPTHQDRDIDLDAAYACARCRLLLSQNLIEWACARTSTAALSSTDTNVLSGILDAWNAATQELAQADALCRLYGLTTMLHLEIVVAKVKSVSTQLGQYELRVQRVALVVLSDL